MNDNLRQRLLAVAQSGTCSKKKVGCIVFDRTRTVELVALANGRPATQRCDMGYCFRCKASEHFSHGRDHDLCSCLHAEQSAICEAAKAGTALEGAWLYSTYQPCLTCLKLIVGSGIVAVRFIEPWLIPDVEQIPNLVTDYDSLVDQLPKGCEPL